MRKFHANFYYVDVVTKADEKVLLECSLKGLLKKANIDIVAGDRVGVDSIDWTTKTARIVERFERSNMMPKPKVANVDAVLITCALSHPSFNPEILDQFLTLVHLSGLTPIICLTKVDLVANEVEIQAIMDLYARQLGYAVFVTSIYQPERVLSLNAILEGKQFVLAGLSGAGKSSLLNVLNPGLSLRVGELSEKIGRGMHTTRHVEFVPLSNNTFVADTPGFSQMSLEFFACDQLPFLLEATFVDFQPFKTDCAFEDCLHTHVGEEGVDKTLADTPAEITCGVLAQVGKGIAVSRYQSYQKLLLEAQDCKATLQVRSQKEAYGVKTRDGRKETQIKLKETARQAGRNTVKQKLSSFSYDEE